MLGKAKGIVFQLQLRMLWARIILIILFHKLKKNRKEIWVPQKPQAKTPKPQPPPTTPDREDDDSQIEDRMISFICKQVN